MPPKVRLKILSAKERRATVRKTANLDTLGRGAAATVMAIGALRRRKYDRRHGRSEGHSNRLLRGRPRHSRLCFTSDGEYLAWCADW